MHLFIVYVYLRNATKMLVLMFVMPYLVFYPLNGENSNIIYKAIYIFTLFKTKMHIGNVYLYSDIRN